MAEAASLVAEEYAKSLSTIRRLGHLTLRCEGAETERQQVENLVFDDYQTAIIEMLKTDPEFRDALDIDREHTHKILDGKVVAADGRPMVSILARGATASKQAARFDKRLQGQAERDACDTINADRVDSLQPGQTLWGLSMDPKHDLAAHKEVYTGLGYREGLAYLQSYTRVDERTLIARSYSVDMSDEAAWRAVLARHGVTIPPDESPNRWLAHAAETQADAATAKQFIRKLRADYYLERGLNAERVSVSEYVEAHSATVRGFFEVYYTALAQAVESGKNNQTLQEFAATLQTTEMTELKPEVRRQLLRIANASRFTSADGKVIDALIRYAVVEELRKGLPEHLQRPAQLTADTVPQGSSGYSMPAAEIHRLLAQNVQRGVAAGRSYGGCSNVDIANRQAATTSSEYDLDRQRINQQEAYGGRAETKSELGKLSVGECIIETCPTRPGKVLIGGCGVCIGRCQKLFDAGKDPTKMLSLSYIFKAEAAKLETSEPKDEADEADAPVYESAEKRKQYSEAEPIPVAA